MARHVVESKDEIYLDGALPDWLAPAAAALRQAQTNNLFDEVDRRLEVVRKSGGHSSAGAIAFLLAFFASYRGEGLRPFYGAALGFWEALSAVADLEQMPSPAALSRLLEHAEAASVRAFTRWLLVEALDLHSLLHHLAVQHQDALGEAWHVFDFDPTGTAFRQRALPDHDEDQSAVRLATGRGKPGTCGRKRGELVSTRAVLQHAGTALLFDMPVSPGAGDPRLQFQSAVEAIVAVCDRIGHPVARALIRTDGQFGGVPYIVAARQAGMAFLSRCARYNLLDKQEVRAALADAAWVFVRDSHSGPHRSAADIGWVLLESEAVDQHGEKFAPQRVRLVVARSEAGDGKPARGRVIDGVCYELFVTDLQEAAWPAEEVVTTYYGRCGQENRFAQEERELDLDRTLSFHPAGQELASAIGAFVWNQRILDGFNHDPPPAESVPQQQPRAPAIDDRDLPVLAAEPTEAPPPVVETEEAAPARPVEPKSAVAQRQQRQRELLRKELPAIFRGTHLAAKGWRLDVKTVGLVCPAEHYFKMKAVAVARHGYAVHFNAVDAVCAGCELKATCRTRTWGGTHSDHYKPVITLPISIGERLRIDNPRPPPRRRTSRPPLVTRPVSLTKPTWAVRTPSFLPAVARRQAQRLVDGVRVVVQRPAPAPKLASHAMIAPTPEDRAHRRQSRSRAAQRYRLHPEVEVRVTLIRRQEPRPSTEQRR